MDWYTSRQDAEVTATTWTFPVGPAWTGSSNDHTYSNAGATSDTDSVVTAGETLVESTTRRRVTSESLFTGFSTRVSVTTSSGSQSGGTTYTNTNGTSASGSTSEFESYESTRSQVTVEADSWVGISESTTSRSSRSRTVGGGTSGTTTATGSTVYPATTDASTTARTAEGTVSTSATSSGTAYTSNLTTTQADAEGRYSTTTTTGNPSWNTITTTTATTSTTTYFGTDDATYPDVSTSSHSDTTWTITEWEYASALRDTVFLMGANLDEVDHNQSHVLWKWSVTGQDTNSTYRGAFAEFYSSDGSTLITMPDFESSSISTSALGTITISRISSTSQTGTATSDTAGTIISQTNGSYWNATDSTEGWTFSVSDGAVSTAASTFTTQTGATTSDTATSSTRIFTHETTVSGYETTGAKPWTSGTTSTVWGISTSAALTRPKWWSVRDTTLRRSYRNTTDETILISSHSTTSTTTGTATSDTAGTAVKLGSVSTTIGRVNTVWSTHATTTTTVGSSCDQWTTSTGTTDTDNSSAVGDTVTSSEDHSFTEATTARVLPYVTSADGQHNIVGQARHEVHPAGFVGFHSSGTSAWTAAAPSFTTESGTDAGADFGGASFTLPQTASAVEGGPTIWPVNSRSGVSFSASGLVSSSLVTPGAGTFAVASVAATVTSTTASGTTTTGTTRSVTCTAGAVSGISNTFFEDVPITWNSEDTNIGVSGFYAATGGWVGGNDQSAAHTVFVPHGRATWTTQTTSTGTSASGSGLTDSYSFTVPQSAAVVVSAEPVLTAEWREDTGNADHWMARTPYITHEIEW